MSERNVQVGRDFVSDFVQREELAPLIFRNDSVIILTMKKKVGNSVFFDVLRK